MKRILLCICVLATFFTYAYDPLLVVVIMIKNEEPVICQTLQPFVDAGIDSFFVFDTGSTDSTIAVTQEFFEKNNITHGIIAQEPFIDFATSRNHALEQARKEFPDACFMIMPDAEWYIQNAQGLIDFCIEHQADPRPLYLVRLLGYNLDFYSARLMRRDAHLEFGGAVHEAITCGTNVHAPDTIYFELRTTNYGLEKSRKRYQRDAEILLKEYEKCPTGTRTVFYLAQTYDCLGNLEEACRWYHKRTSMKGMAEEDYIAHYRLALVYEALNIWEKALFYYFKAIALRPHRAEPLIHLAQHFWNTGDYALCFLFARRACELPYPSSDLLFIEKELYSFTRHALLSQAAWYVGEYELGEQEALKALACYPDNSQLQKNLACYSTKKSNH